MRERKFSSILRTDTGEVILEYLVFGEGSPRTFLLSGIHGDEKTGQIIISKLFENFPDFSGTLTVLRIANPSGFSANTREEVTTDRDLNRSFVDTDSDSIVSKITSEITEVASRNDYVIDLHNYSTAGLIQAVSNHVGSADFVAMQMKPDVIRTSGVTQVAKSSGILARRLKGLGVPYVLIEAPVESAIREEQIERLVSGICRHLEQCAGCQAINNSGIDSVPKVVIRKIQATCDGVFVKIDRLELGRRIKKSDLLGEMRDLVGNIIGSVRSEYDGIVCEMDEFKSRTLKTGDVILRVGETA